MIIAKQGADPSFGFLFNGGIDNQYYQWRTYAVIKRKWNEDQITQYVDQYFKFGHLPPSLPPPPPPPPPPPMQMRLPVPLPSTSPQPSIPSAPPMAPQLEAEFQRKIIDTSSSRGLSH
jgi:hypothetical protein